jgi:hypothetical protein
MTAQLKGLVVVLQECQLLGKHEQDPSWSPALSHTHSMGYCLPKGPH